MKKTKQCDALLRRIVACLEQGEGPTIQDGVAFEELLWAYKEHDSQNTASIGLRNRVSCKPQEQEAGDVSGLGERMQIAANHLIHGKIPPPKDKAEFIKRANAYLSGRLTAANFLGERDRRPRNGNIPPFEFAMGIIAGMARDRVKPAKGKKLRAFSADHSPEEPLYLLLVGLSKRTPNADLIREYKLQNSDATRQVLTDLKTQIHGEVDDAVKSPMLDHVDDTEGRRILLGLLRRPSRWHAAHRRYLREERSIARASAKEKK